MHADHSGGPRHQRSQGTCDTVAPGTEVLGFMCARSGSRSIPGLCKKDVSQCSSADDIDGEAKSALCTVHCCLEKQQKDNLCCLAKHHEYNHSALCIAADLNNHTVLLSSMGLSSAAQSQSLLAAAQTV